MVNNGRKVRNSISRPQARKLEDYILKVLPEIQKEHMDVPTIIKMAQIALGFHLVGSNVRSAFKTLGLELPVRRAFGGTMKGVPVQAIKEALALVADIAGELGRTVPPILREFADRYRAEKHDDQ